MWFDREDVYQEARLLCLQRRYPDFSMAITDALRKFRDARVPSRMQDLVNLPAAHGSLGGTPIANVEAREWIQRVVRQYLGTPKRERCLADVLRMIPA